ncbi:MAG TPA: STAS domain-containing protein [Thermoguttaceae bacterium]|nr:STAS domain-containing protein [Thermoguttaceae bacterium]
MSILKTFHTESEDETLIVMPQGSVSSLAGDEVSSELDELLERLERPGPNNVVVDFEKVSYFGTVMLGAMHAIWKHVREEGGKMVLCNVSDMGREILRVSGIDVLWPVCASRQEAIEEVNR